MDIETSASGQPIWELKGRRLKQHVGRLLEKEPFLPALDQLLQIPPRRVVSPLFSFLYHGRSIVRWRAVSAMGEVVSRQAETDPAAAQIVMRRLMWNLNDESGGIGWGSPEAMGDIMARSRPLARSYHHILISYIDPKGNYLEHEVLQQGALWGIGRLCHALPETGAACGSLLLPFLGASDAPLRGLAAWAAIPLASTPLRPALETLAGDHGVLRLYEGMTLVEKTVGELARKALGNIHAKRSGNGG
jgi:hypothetical protein